MNFFTLNLTPYPGEKAEEDVLNALTNAVDLDGNPLFAPNGVKRGVDAEMNDAFFRNPGETVCPIVILQTWSENEVSAQGGGRINTDYMMSLYFIYYFGVPSTNPIPVTYVKQRRRHLTAAMKAIEMQSGGNMTATIQPRGWKWDTSRQTIFTYEAPLENIGKTIIVPPENGYDCVRVNRPISIWHAM